jgi:predicted transcriptional regulator
MNKIRGEVIDEVKRRNAEAMRLHQELQIDWLARTHHRFDGPDTSKQAARSMKASAQTLCDRILELLKIAPATVDELAKALDLDGHCIGRRTSDLRNDGLIEPSEYTRKGLSGRQMTVWRVKQ